MVMKQESGEKKRPEWINFLLRRYELLQNCLLPWYCYRTGGLFFKICTQKNYFLPENTSQNSFVINEQIAKVGPKSS